MSSADGVSVESFQLDNSSEYFVFHIFLLWITDWVDIHIGSTLTIFFRALLVAFLCKISWNVSLEVVKI